MMIAVLLPACESSTYKKETIQQSVAELAKKEYKLDVEVKEAGRTLGVRFRVRSLLSELVAEDQLFWKQMDDLMMVLSRVALSTDVPPEFFVLEIADAENPRIRLLFTRCIQDVRKVMAEALSRTQYLDRLLIEFVLGDKRMNFDPSEMDLVRLMMMAVDIPQDERPAETEFRPDEVPMPEFLAKVAANYARRVLRDKKDMKDEYLLRQVTASYQTSHFTVLLDLVSAPGARQTAGGQARPAPGFLESRVLPMVAKEVATLFRSYKFEAFSGITVIEKNSGKILTVPRK